MRRCKYYSVCGDPVSCSRCKVAKESLTCETTWKKDLSHAIKVASIERKTNNKPKQGEEV